MVAASCVTTALINLFKVEALVFTGVAGGLTEALKVGDIVVRYAAQPSAPQPLKHAHSRVYKDGQVGGQPGGEGDAHSHTCIGKHT